MDVRFLFGPAGTGKTHQCLAELRTELRANPEGLPLVFLAPKQATFQLERQLLAGHGLAGFMRLQIFSFPRLAHFLQAELGDPEPQILDESGRVMVLRALLRKHEDELEIFRRSARQVGFATEFSRQLREFQEQRVSPAQLEATAAEGALPNTLRAKLRDTARLARAYLLWLKDHGLTDGDALLDTAADGLVAARRSGRQPRLGAVWLDGFAEMTPQELRLLAETVASADRSTLAFCLDQVPPEHPEPLSPWSVVGDTFRKCHARLQQLEGVKIRVTQLERQMNSGPGRFRHTPFLAHLEANWPCPRPAAWHGAVLAGQRELNLAAAHEAACVLLEAGDSVEAEALLAARQVQSYVAAGGRYRECAVLLRSLDTHGDAFRRTWRRLAIPMFLDRREPVGNEPLTTLTRGALRTAIGGWRHDDWFGALRSGLAGLEMEAVDALENEALAGGWSGSYWDRPRPAEGRIENANHHRLVEPFRTFADAIREEPTGREIAAAIQALWQCLKVEVVLKRWDDESDQGRGLARLASHQAVRRQLDQWLEEVCRALGTTRMPAPAWLDVFESAWVGLTIGLVPPALDQVLVGAIDRSRNPNLELVILPGWNDGIFPQSTPVLGLLTALERQLLFERSTALQLPTVVAGARESFYAYIALSRARSKVVVTWSEASSSALLRSPFIARLIRCGAQFEPSAIPAQAVNLWREFPTELNPTLILEPAVGTEHLTKEVAAALYGRTLYLSASRLERMATCPHQSFLMSALRINERDVWCFEAREQGDLAHELLAEFHRTVVRQHGSWANLNPASARIILEDAARRIRRTGPTDGRRDFLASGWITKLGRFVADTTEWLPGYRFLPHSAELRFGRSNELSALKLALGEGASLVVEGKIDRIDQQSEKVPQIIVLDYKSSNRRWDQRAMSAGLEIQLPVYGLALRAAGFQVAGLAYVGLSGRSVPSKSRTSSIRSVPFPHNGRFSVSVLGASSNSSAGEADGFPFKWKLKKNGEPTATGDLRTNAVFDEILAEAQRAIESLARNWLKGEAAARPSSIPKELPCERCNVRRGCRK